MHQKVVNGHFISCMADGFLQVFCGQKYLMEDVQTASSDSQETELLSFLPITQSSLKINI